LRKRLAQAGFQSEEEGIVPTYDLLLNRVFSKNTFANVLEKTSESVFPMVLRTYFPNEVFINNAEVFKKTYRWIKTEYRNEYYYKNTLLNKLLVNRHRINTTTALTELPIGKSIADLIMVNGKAQVYEIKTDLDNTDRLESQIADYYKAFDHVSVVTSEQQMDCIHAMIPSTVGLHVLNRRESISTVREPLEDRSRLDLQIIFRIMLKQEFEAIIKKYCALPSVRQFEYYDACFDLLEALDINTVYADFLEQLKSRRKIFDNNLFMQVPEELRFLVYFSSYKQDDYEKLQQFLSEECKSCISHI
jgi:hypothetical protein